MRTTTTAMPNYRRPHQPGGTFFFTLVTYKRQPILLEALLRQTLRQAIQNIRKTFPFQIDAWVLLPDHLHCVWTLPDGDENFSLRWALIKQEVSKHCGKAYALSAEKSASQKKRRESTLWQRRFWDHQIRDERDFAHHLDYLHWNPVKHGLVTAVAAWPYSTFHRYVRQGMYPLDWGTTEDFQEAEFGE